MAETNTNAEIGQKIPRISNFDKSAENNSGNESDSNTSSSTGSDHDDDWNDWVDDDNQALPTRSLFDESTLENAQLALKYDKDTHGFDLVAFCAQLGPQIVHNHRSKF
jgi:protein arginine N-methyltransferase 3